MQPRINIFNTNVSVTNINEAPGQIIKLCKTKPGYICLPDAYVIVSATKNQKLQNILNNSLLTIPDGSPLVIYAKLKGIKGISSVSGYWLVKKLMDTELSHYFYGSSPEELMKIKVKLDTEFPHAHVLGYKSPPLIELDEIEGNSQILTDINEINQLNTDIIWVGLNSPKQDYLMSAYSPLLDKAIMVGIGGVFDYLSGAVKISPEWVKKISLRWVYRIAQSPRRLYKKTFIAIFGFSWLTLLEFLKIKK